MTSVPTLQIDHVLICEEVRSEQGGKHTIIGFYGFSPHVKVIVTGPGQLSRIGVLFAAAPLDRETEFSGLDVGFGKAGEENSFHFVKLQGKKIAAGKATQVVVQLVAPQLPHFGRYVAVLRQHGTVFGRGEFEVVAGEPKDLASESD